jgi:hypothetical protein
MTKERIEVIAYSGYRGEESPRIILSHGKRIEVIEILSQWIEEQPENRERKRFFKIRDNDAALRMIYYDEKLTEWFHVSND